MQYRRAEAWRVLGRCCFRSFCKRGEAAFKFAPRSAGAGLAGLAGPWGPVILIIFGSRVADELYGKNYGIYGGLVIVGLERLVGCNCAWVSEQGMDIQGPSSLQPELWGITVVQNTVSLADNLFSSHSFMLPSYPSSLPNMDFSEEE